MIRWEGTQDSGAEWQCSWEPATNLDCHKLLMQWEMCSAQERGRRRHRARLMTAAEALALPISAVTQMMRPVTLDLTEAARIQKETGITVITQICNILGLTIDEIVFVWSSPPCESYAWLGYTNDREEITSESIRQRERNRDLLSRAKSIKTCRSVQWHRTMTYSPRASR